MKGTVQAVKEAESADEKRRILNESFTDMLTAVEKIEEKAELSDREKEQLAVLKDNITAKSNQLNGLDGYDKVGDEERSEEHTSELQSRGHLVCRLLLEQKQR